MEDQQQKGMSRRAFVGSTLATAAATTMLPGCRFVAGSGSNTIPEPPNFPAGITLYQQTFENWAREIIVAGVWFCSPNTPDDVVTLANWAHANGYRLRPFGSGHGFAPTLLPRGDSGEKVVLVNTQDHMHTVTVDAVSDIKSAHCGAGAILEKICRECEAYDLGLYHTTAPGSITIAGALAMNAHGAAIPAEGETLQPGHSWGSLSNLILELNAVVWDEAQGQYVLKNFKRDEPAIGPLLTCLARAFVTDVKLQLGPNLKIRCVSRTDIKISELLAMPENATENSFANLCKQYGTVDTLYYPYRPDDRGWIKSWTVTPEKPAESRYVVNPYNYQDSSMSPAVADLIASAIRSYPKIAVPMWGKTSTNSIVDLLANDDPDTQLHDLWGSAYTTTLYVQPMTPRNTVAAWGVIIARENLQRCLGEFHQYFSALVADYQSRGLYPYSGPVELRAHGLDNPEEVLIPNAVEPTISGPRPHPDHPEKDTIVWFAINNTVDMPHAAEFNYDLEQWFFSNYASYGIVRPEWTKCYAYTPDGANGGGWTNDEILLQTFPDTWRAGYPTDATWDTAVAQLNAMDPHRIFTNTYLDKVFPADS